MEPDDTTQPESRIATSHPSANRPGDRAPRHRRPPQGKGLLW